MRNNKLSFIFFVIIISVLIFGIFRLFAVRFESGDIYPVYSTLRSDPLGCMAFHDSLLNLKSLTVKRNYTPIINTKPNNNSVLFYLGMHPSSLYGMPKSHFEALNRFVLSGGHLVISLKPVNKNFVIDNIKKQKKEVEDEKDNLKPCNVVSLLNKWGFEYDTITSNDKDNKKTPNQNNLISHSPYGSVSWHSKLFLTKLSKEWDIIATVEDDPVIIERKYGNGSIIICTDTYFISNEGLRNESTPALLTFMIGKNSNIIFDEAHLGIQKNPGITSLILKYNLYGPVIAIFIFAILFIRKNSSHFLPPFDTVKAPQVSARDQSSGLISLLKRNINKDKLLNICINEWEKSFASGHNSSKHNMELLKKIKQTVQTKEDGTKPSIEPVEGYRKIFKLLSEGKNR
ncbi:MAG: hypothetical protein KKC46_14345 [Proteobacteria bacterium]|nr:hypothetical protein [Pseudomonadota bacterium]